MVVKILAKIIFGLCACNAPPGDPINVSCSNTTAQPGLVCTLPNLAFKAVFKLSTILWEAYVKLSNMCFNPMSPL